MWVRKRLDISWRDLLFAVTQCGWPGNSLSSWQKGGGAWCGADDVLPCLSVRSGFDLLLGALDFPPKSELLVSALTIPDMVRIAEDHGLVAVPVDLDLDTAGPSVESMRRAITPATRAVVVAHLFGGRTRIEPILDLARQHRLLVVEDCAQAFHGARYRGHPQADVSMFSFGSIKTATALGGGVLRVRDAELLRRMRDRQAAWPVQGRWNYLRRLLKYALLKVLSSRACFGLVVRTWAALGRDYDRLVNGSVRGFPGPDFFARIRRQPSAPLLTLLARRLEGYDEGRLSRRTSNGEVLASLLGETVACLGLAMNPHNYWVFPILAEEPERVIAGLRRAGFDATQGQSMCAVAPPPDRPEQAPRNAANALAKIVYLPNYPELPERAARKMAEVVLRTAEKPAFLNNGSPRAPQAPARPVSGSPAVEG